MSRVLRLGLAAIAVALLAWAAYGAANRVYLQRQARLTRDIESTQATIDRYRRALDDEQRVAESLLAIAERTLGAELETVDHRLRVRLNRIAEQLELEEVVVGTGAASSRESPARSTFRGPFREMRDEVDLVEVEAWVSGVGTLEQALRLVDVIQSEPWIKRVTQAKLDGGDNGQRVAVSVRLQTLLLPGLPPSAHELPPYDPAGFDEYAGLLARNPFMVPPKPEPVPPPPAPVASVKPRPRYDHWALTGVATGPAGAEVWLSNGHDGASRRLTIGELVERAVLVAVDGDRATFELDEKLYMVGVGETLGTVGAAAQR